MPSHPAALASDPQRSCVVDTRDLGGFRIQQIGAMLAPLTHTRAGVEQLPFGGSVVFAAHTGPRPRDVHFRDWRVNTFVPNVRGLYFERWTKADRAARTLYLECANLHLLFRKQDREHELVLLHCEPNVAEDPPGDRNAGGNQAPLRHAEYKRSLHLHVAQASFPLDHSHFPLYRAGSPLSFTSLDEFQAAQTGVVEVLREQVLRLYEHELQQNERSVVTALR